MRVERKSGRQSGDFWLIVFHDEADKRGSLDALKSVGDDLSEKGKEVLSSLICKIDTRCKHDDRYQKGEEIASCIFDSDVDEIILLLFVFASIMKDWEEPVGDDDDD